MQTSQSDRVAIYSRESAPFDANPDGTGVVLMIEGAVIQLGESETFEANDVTVQKLTASSADTEAFEITFPRSSVTKVEVNITGGYVNLLLVLAGSAFNHSLGLLGKWDTFPENDFTTPSGQVVEYTDNFTKLHYEFGLTCTSSKFSHFLFVYFCKQLVNHFFQFRIFKNCLFIYFSFYCTFY